MPETLVGPVPGSIYITVDYWSISAQAALSRRYEWIRAVRDAGSLSPADQLGWIRILKRNKVLAFGNEDILP